MLAVKDIEAQMKGFVSIFYNMDLGEYEAEYMEAMKRVKKMLTESLPYRNVAVHYCLNDPGMMRALAVFKMFTGKNHRVRFRTHFGMFVYIFLPAVVLIDRLFELNIFKSFLSIYFGIRISRRDSLCTHDVWHPQASASVR